jgi:hypothetical protein
VFRCTGGRVLTMNINGVIGCASKEAAKRNAEEFIKRSGCKCHVPPSPPPPRPCCEGSG